MCVSNVRSAGVFPVFGNKSRGTIILYAFTPDFPNLRPVLEQADPSNLGTPTLARKRPLNFPGILLFRGCESARKLAVPF